jgi:hypothetical protein
MADYSYLGSGKVYLREIGATLGFLEVGNCSALNFAVTEDTKELKDFTQPGGGTYNEVKRISAVECSFSAHDLSSENLARALYGTAGAVAAGAVTNESITVYPGAYAPFANLPASSPAPVIDTPGTAAATRANTTPYALGAYVVPAVSNGFYYKATAAGTSAGTLPTYPTTIGGTVTDGTVTWTCAGKVAPVADTDYEVRPGGVFVYTSATIAGEAWAVDYTKVAASKMEALTSSGKEYELVFDGLNEARSGKRTRVSAYRVKAGALANLALIGEDYGVAECTGKLLKDTSKTGNGVSQYFKVEIET